MQNIFSIANFKEKISENYKLGNKGTGDSEYLVYVNNSQQLKFLNLYFDWSWLINLFWYFYFNFPIEPIKMSLSLLL